MTRSWGLFKCHSTYNARGERVIKIVDDIETHFIFDLSGKLIAEADANGNILREYVYSNDAPLAQIVDSDIYYYHNSHLGTPESMTDSAQAVVWSSSYTPFGMGSVTTGVVENNLRFPGQYYDSETGLHYNYFRYYDPATGRYITSDPIGLLGGINTYAYVGSNPIMWFDPFGLAGETVDLGGGTKVRVDNPHVPGQQKHAHVKTPKGEVVVNKDGTQSHKSKGSLDNLNNKARKFLEKVKGFKFPGFPFLIDPCLIDPSICNQPPACPDA